VKRYAVILFIFGMFWAPLYSEGGSAFITNGDSDPFYFVVDPAGFDKLAIGNPAPVYEWVSKFFGSTKISVPFDRIDSGETKLLSELYPGTHLIVGFFKRHNSLRYPVKALGLTIKKEISYRTSYILYEEPVLLTVEKNSGILKNYFISKTNEIPVVTVPKNIKQGLLAAASFADSFKPSTFTLKKDAVSGVYPISNSQFWGKGGTKLVYFKILDIKNEKIGLQVYSDEGFSKNLSFFLYIYLHPINKKENTYTLEVKPLFKESRNGFIILWKKGEKKPLIIGSVNTNGSAMNGEIDLNRLPFSIDDIEKTNLTIDLSSCWFDSSNNSYEEFFLSSLKISAKH